MVVVLVGLLGTYLMLDVAVTTSAANRARSGATNLAREITEDSRAIPFSQMSPSTIESQLQAMPGLTNTDPGGAWQISRDGTTYTVTASECSVDDPKDGYGVHDSTFCPDSSTQGTTDPQPIDFKRVTVAVSWSVVLDRGSHQTHTIQEVATLNSSGQPLGLKTTGLSVSGGPLDGSADPTVTPSTGVTSLQFQVTTPSGATAIVWTVDGAAQSWTSTSSSNGSGLQWISSAWNFSGISDGTYQVGAAAENSAGVVGPAVTIPVTLIRNVPAAPTLAFYGFNTNLSKPGGTTGTAVELQWQPNSERNVVGYQITSPTGATCTTTQGGANATADSACGTQFWCQTPAACIDLSPPSATGTNLTYKIAATYYDSTDTLQTGPSSNATVRPIKTYALAPTTNNAGTNCVGGTGTTLEDMLGSYTPSATDSTASGLITFCSDPFSSGDTIEGGGTAVAYFVNSGASSCQVKATLDTNGSSTGAVTATATVPSGTTTATPYTFTFTNDQQETMNAGDELNLGFDMSATTCGSTVLHYGSTGAPSSFQTAPIPVTPPGTPASLTVTTQPDGTAILTWPVSTSGPSVNFYRIYRTGASGSGPDYTERYDTVPATDCSSGTCTYDDVKRTTSQEYWVTAVGGTAAGSDMDESPAVGPVTG
jgi:Tfp pilus assembly protein PilV